ncbi:MAG: MarC family protein [Bacteroidota bacterium]|nr:MarC family protein [Bacteroidota bacterium]
MELRLQDVLSVTMILFAVIDIIGSIPVIIALRRKSGHIYALRATLAALGIMIFFLFMGELILELIGIDVESFAIAGSIVIFLIAIEMLLGISLYRDEMPQSASVVPLAFPIIAGTGTMTTILSLRAEYTYATILVGIALNLVLVYLVIRNIHFLEKMLGPVGNSVLRKVFAVVLLAVAIKLFRQNAGV